MAQEERPEGALQLVEHFHRRSEPDDRTGGAHPRARSGIEHRTAAGGEHELRSLEQLRQRVAFELPEVRLSGVVKDLADGPAGPAFDFRVGIDPLPPEPRRHERRHRALAAAAISDERDHHRF